MAKKGTGAAFDQYLSNELRDPKFRDLYKRQVKLLKSEQRLLAAIDHAREKQQLSKAELARRTGKQLPAVSRLLSPNRSRAANPRLATLLEIIDAVDLQIEVRPRTKQRRELVAVSPSL